MLIDTMKTVPCNQRVSSLVCIQYRLVETQSFRQCSEYLKVYARVVGITL